LFGFLRCTPARRAASVMESRECLVSGAACSSRRLGLSRCCWLSQQPWPIRSVQQPLQLLQPNETRGRLRPLLRLVQRAQRRHLLVPIARWCGRLRQSSRPGRRWQGLLHHRQGMRPLPGRPSQYRPRLLRRASGSQSRRCRQRQRTREAKSRRPQNRRQASRSRSLRPRDRPRASSGPKSLPRLRQRRRPHRIQRRSRNRRSPAPLRFSPRLRNTPPFTVTMP